jgi:Ala-tRNA(Pro) deacylase
MINVSEVKKGAPKEFKNELQRLTYTALNELSVEYTRVDNDEARTMEDCAAINEKLDCKVVKTLFLCNRQKTSFYLFITEGDKPFVTKIFSKVLGVSRVSFAPPELLLSLAGVEPGATTFFAALIDKEQKISIIIDRDVLKEEYFGCTDGTLTTYMKIKTDDVLRILEYANHKAKIIDVNTAGE